MPLNKFGRHAGRTYNDDDDDSDFDEDEYLNMRNRRIIQLAPAINDADAVNKKFLEEQLEKIAGKLNNHIIKAETNIQKANAIIREFTGDIEALFKHLNIKKGA